MGEGSRMRGKARISVTHFLPLAWKSDESMQHKMGQMWREHACAMLYLVSEA